MSNDRWQFRFAAGMLILSGALYTARWFLFPQPGMHQEMLRYLVDDVGFLFLQVLLVTVFIDRMIQRRERAEIAQKLNMIIGSFFSELGTDVLGLMSTAETTAEADKASLVPHGDWGAAEYRAARARFESHDPTFELRGDHLTALRERLSAEKSYMLGLLANQALLEHGEFTDLMWALTHVAEELKARRDLYAIPASDAKHLEGDLGRAYRLLGSQWLAYLEHLQRYYPYLFSLAMRTNPVDPDADPEVR